MKYLETAEMFIDTLRENGLLNCDELDDDTLKQSLNDLVEIDCRSAIRKYEFINKMRELQSPTKG